MRFIFVMSHGVNNRTSAYFVTPELRLENHLKLVRLRGYQATLVKSLDRGLPRLTSTADEGGFSWLWFYPERDGLCPVYLPKTCYARMNISPAFNPDMCRELVKCSAAHRPFDHTRLWVINKDNNDYDDDNWVLFPSYHMPKDSQK